MYVPYQPISKKGDETAFVPIELQEAQQHNEIKNNDNNNVLDIIREIFRNKISFLLDKLDAILQEEIKAKRIREISALDLVLTIVSLNIFVFLAYPIVDYVLSVNEKGVELIIQQRKKEIVNTILNSLRP